MLLIRILDVTVVDAILPSVPIEVSDSLELARDNRDGVLRADGDSVTLARGTNIPYLSGHSKYLREVDYIIQQINNNDRNKDVALFFFSTSGHYDCFLNKHIVWRSQFQLVGQ